MTNDGFRLQIFASTWDTSPPRRPLLYVDTDTTVATRYAEGTAGMDNARRDGEGEDTP
jgi:hypothetical protein